MSIDQLTFLINKLHNSIFYLFSLFFEEFYNFIIKVVKIPGIGDNFEKIIGHLTNRPFLFFTIIIYAKQYLMTLLNEIVTLFKNNGKEWIDTAVGNNTIPTKATELEKKEKDEEEVTTEIFEEEKDKLIKESSSGINNSSEKRKDFTDRLKEKRDRERKINGLVSEYINEFENETKVGLKYESEVKIDNGDPKTSFIGDGAVILNGRILFLLEILIHTSNNTTNLGTQRINMIERRSMERLRYYKFNFDTLLIVLDNNYHNISYEDNEDIKIIRISKKHLSNSEFKFALFSKIKLKIIYEGMSEFKSNRNKKISGS